MAALMAQFLAWQFTTCYNHPPGLFTTAHHAPGAPAGGGRPAGRPAGRPSLGQKWNMVTGKQFPMCLSECHVHVISIVDESNLI